MKYSASFSGSNYLSVANFTGNPASFSVSCWVYLAVAQVSRIFFSNYGGNGWAPGISDGSTNKVKFFLGSNTLTSATALATGVWTHVVCTYDGTTAKVYLNGNTTPDASLVSSVVYGSVPASNYIGSLNGSIQQLNGGLAAVGYWSKALSTAEVTSLYNGGNGLLFADLSGTLLTSLGAYYDFGDSSNLGTDSSANARNMANTGTVPWAGVGPSGAIYTANGPYLPPPRRLAANPAWLYGLKRALTLQGESGSMVGVRDAVTGAALSLTGTPGWGRDCWGNCLSLSGGGVLFGLPVPHAATEFTLAALCTLDGSAAVVSNRCLWEEPASGSCNMRLVLSGGLLQFQLGADGAFTNLTATPQLANVPVLVTARLAPGGVRSIWYGPYKQAQRTDALGVYGSGSGSDLEIGTGAGNWAGNISAGYVWNRALTDNEIIQLAADPFAPVRANKLSLSNMYKSAGLIYAPSVFVGPMMGALASN